MTFDELYCRLLRRTGDYVDAPANSKDADYSQFLVDSCRHVWNASFWPQLMVLTKEAVSLDENGSAYVEIPSGRLAAVYASDPTLKTPRTFSTLAECSVFNARLYVPAKDAYVWIEKLPPPPNWDDDDNAAVPDFVARVAIEFACADIYEKRGEYDRANTKRALAERYLDEELFKTQPLTSTKIYYHV
jgi:hypothetical protein